MMGCVNAFVPLSGLVTDGSGTGWLRIMGKMNTMTSKAGGRLPVDKM
jgi:hypothetical protein